MMIGKLMRLMRIRQWMKLMSGARNNGKLGLVKDVNNGAMQHGKLGMKMKDVNGAMQNGKLGMVKDVNGTMQNGMVKDVNGPAKGQGPQALHHRGTWLSKPTLEQGRKGC